jgi:hypothetical protein
MAAFAASCFNNRLTMAIIISGVALLPCKSASANDMLICSLSKEYLYAVSADSKETAQSYATNSTILVNWPESKSQPELTSKNIIDVLNQEYSSHKVEFYSKYITGSLITANVRNYRNKFLALQSDITSLTNSINYYLSAIYPEIDFTDCNNLLTKANSIRNECLSFRADCESEINNIATRILMIKLPNNYDALSDQTKQNQREEVKLMKDNLILDASLLKYMKDKTANDISMLEVDALENHCKNLQIYEQR